MADNNLLANKIVQALQTTFGRSDRQMRILKGQELPQEKLSHGDSIETRLSKIWTGQSDIQMDRMSKYRDYDKMDINSTECMTALDIYAEEASIKDTKTGMRVWADSKDKNIREELNGMFQRIKLEFKAYGMYRNIAKYGDAYNYLILGGYGIHDTQVIHPSRIQRIQEDGLLGFKAQELAGMIPMDNRVGMFKPYEFIHYRIQAFDEESVYGRSFMASLRKIWKQYSMLQTMLVLYRIAKSVSRNIFYVDVGQSSAAETQVIIKDYEKFLKNKQTFIDPRTNDFKLDFNPATMLQDIIWPHRTNSQSKVEALQNTSNIGPLEDLEHFRNQMITGLGIPKAFLDGELDAGWNSKDALLLQSTRFGRKITKLQDSFREGVIKMCQIHWAITHQEYLDPSSFTINLGTTSDQAERSREDILLRKAQILEILGNLSVTMGWNRHVWGDYLLDEVYPLPANLRMKLQTPDPTREDEFEKTKELVKLGGGGKMSKVKEPKPQKKVTADNLRVGLRGFGSKAMAEEFAKTLPESEATEFLEQWNAIDELSPELSEEFAEQLNNLDNNETYNFNNMGGLVNQNICGFRQEELQELIKKVPEIKERYKVQIPGQDPYAKKVNWKQLQEMGKPDPKSLETIYEKE